VENHMWSNLFVHNDALYLCGTSTGYGDLIIRKSTDGGVTWTTPDSAATGVLRAAGTYGYHTSSMPMAIADGRIWRAYEDDGSGGGWPYHFRAYLMSAPVDRDPLDAASWTHTNALPSNTTSLPGDGLHGWLA